MTQLGPPDADIIDGFRREARDADRRAQDATSRAHAEQHRGDARWWRQQAVDWELGFVDRDAERRDATNDQVSARRLDDIAERLAETVIAEPPEQDPGLARLQEARDWSAARGEFELADSQDRLLNMLRRQQPTRPDEVLLPLQRARPPEREL